MLNKLQHGTPVNATNSGSTATATVTGIAGKTMYVTDIAGSSDKAGSILSVKDGSTTIWQVQLATTAAGINAFDQRFESPLACTAGADMTVSVDGTTTAKANVAGFYI